VEILAYSTIGCFTSRRSKAFFLIELTQQVSARGKIIIHIKYGVLKYILNIKGEK
jgi:hypothetical protein